MRYVILFGIVALIGAVLGALAERRWGLRVAGIIGAVLTALAALGFWLNKSDSVADTPWEHIADAVPPLVSFSLVAGWWIGLATVRMVGRLR